MTTRKKLLYQISLWTLLIAAIILLLSISPALMTPENLAADDFGHFWAAGKLTLKDQNPYDPQAILNLLYQVGRLPENTSIVSIMLNPPWSLPIVMLFAMFSYPVSRMLWLIINIMIIMVSATMLWSIYRGPKKTQWLAWLIAFTFTPSIATLQKGQFTPLILIGLVGFLAVADQIIAESSRRFNNNQLILIAGFSISLMAIKPQLLYLFWLGLLLWCWQQRKLMILMVGGLFLIIEIIIPTLFNPNVLLQYIHNILEYPLSEWATPTISSYLRWLLGLNKLWLQLLPPLLGASWFMYHWYHRRNNWIWISEMPVLVLVSVVTSPYYWTYDLVTLLPAIILVTVTLLTHLRHRPLTKRDSVTIFVFIAINILNIALHTALNEFWFGWVAPALLIWFLFSYHDDSSTVIEQYC